MLNRFYKGDFFICKIFKLTPQIIETVKTSIAMDYHYLVLLTTVSDEEFLNSLDSLALDEYFYYSINAILSEYKKVLKDKNFLKRFSMVIKRNNELINTIDNEEMVKMMNKYNRYYKLFLKGE